MREAGYFRESFGDRRKNRLSPNDSRLVECFGNVIGEDRIARRSGDDHFFVSRIEIHDTA